MLTSGTVLAASMLGCSKSSASPIITSVNSRRVVQTLPGMPTMDGAGVSLTRIIGQPRLRNLDPFILLDRIHSDNPTAYIRGFPDHPHRGFETVTVMLDGKMRHHDSRDNRGLITGGGAQWMTAGRGIVHSEMPEQDNGLLSGFQLWVNLPAREKMCTPYYQDLQPAQLAEAQLSRAGSSVRVIAGHANGVVGPVRERPTSPTLLVLNLADDTPFELDVADGHAAFAYVGRGDVTIGPNGAESNVQEKQLAILGDGNRIRFQARTQASQVLIAAGRPLREPIVQRGPFVMNTEEEIERAFADYRNGTLVT